MTLRHITFKKYTGDMIGGTYELWNFWRYDAFVNGKTNDGVFGRCGNFWVSAREIKREFKEIIKRQPDIGGYRNNLLMGLYLAAYLAAVYKARSDTVTEKYLPDWLKQSVILTLCEK